jgi:hypothetical protein
VRHVEFLANLSLVWMKIGFLEISSAILYEIHEIQNKKVKKISKIKKLGSFFDFHTKRPKLQNRGMPLVALILEFGG